MGTFERRSFLRGATSIIALVLTQAAAAWAQLKPARVARGEDREQKPRSVGVSATTFKVLTAETNGAMFVMENANSAKGGPPRHLHHDVDELFYVLEGEYVVEVGSERFALKAGECVLGPRGIPHAFAFVGQTPGRLLLTFAPAGKMEAFFNSRERRGIKPGLYATAGDAETFREFGMEYVGPPLRLE